ncbi:hypothetical protein NCLIV_035320 [Neospora caninum Liverpool]|uniref:Protein FAM135B n=1 Tax=Neospora caninum (strain Liverpool) TaxID=572307 RepID=F0VJ39_NEOCL|nr:hypothetical protein NCLIV_035320 [Neospora caninum Liverpool]CBZ53750.1 hypothetical protein NCLIV_035320 [Neospora caninum Liverpool]CEL67742.1 TPA: Protein FAM135B [Neospora caninum Liverpool]|eukprot:XP_003883782.1 hypothetical protein NCLIV_035320 [Neospora caninum Liverpool]
METPCSVAASAFEPGEEPVSSFFSRSAFSTFPYRDIAEPAVSVASEAAQTEKREGRKFPASLADLFSLERQTRAFLAPALSSLGLLRSATAKDEPEKTRGSVAGSPPASPSAASGDSEGVSALLLPEGFSLASTFASDLSLSPDSQPSPLRRLQLHSETPAKEAANVPPVCLVVCVHGLAGVSSDFQFTQSVLNERAPHIRVLVSRANTGKTFDGVKRGGERLADEIRQEVARFPSLSYISVIGFSLGGLYMRYAVRLLYSPSSASAPATVCGLRPLCVGTVASPHLGVRRFSYLPVPEGLMRPLLSSYFLLTSHLRARSGSASAVCLERGEETENEAEACLVGREAVAADSPEASGTGRGAILSGDGEAVAADSPEASGTGRGAILSGDGETEGGKESLEDEHGSEHGFNLGRLSQLHESRTLADLMLVSEREYTRELQEAEKKLKNEKMLSWLWGRRGSGAENDEKRDAEREEKKVGEEKSEQGREDELAEEDEDEEPLLVQMSQGVFVDSLKVFSHRRLYANARGDILVPLGTAAIDPSLPANAELQKILNCTPRSMIVGSGRVVMISHPERPPLYVASSSLEEVLSSSALHNDALPRPPFLSQQSTHYLSPASSAEGPALQLSGSAVSASDSDLPVPSGSELPSCESGVRAAETKTAKGGECEEYKDATATRETDGGAGPEEGKRQETSTDLDPPEHPSSFPTVSSPSSLFSFSLRRSSSSSGWREWLKLNTHGEIEAAMASRLNEVKWTKVIVDFPTFVPVAHDSINASGKSRFRTWVTAGGRPIVEQLVDWLVSSLDEALAADRLKQVEVFDSSKEYYVSEKRNAYS